MYLNLDAALPLLTPLYCDKPRGQESYPPLVMLRSLILMHLLQVESLPKWAKLLQTFPRLQKMCGFSPHNTPCAGTFYGVIDRLEDGQYTTKAERKLLPSKRRKGLHLRSLPQEKAEREALRKQALKESDTLTEKRAAQLIENDAQPRANDLQTLLEDLLIRCAVIPSSQKGLLGDLEKLTLSGDGSPLVSSANGNGKPSCECRKQGKRKCGCPRLYTDPTANWGKDSYRETYYFGHTLYQHVVSTEGHDLPVHIVVGQATAYDGLLALDGIDRFQKACDENGVSMKIEHAIYDAGHDATGVYNYLNHYEISPIIALREKNVSLADIGKHPVTERGYPICKAGLEMRRHSYAKNRKRVSFNCPVKRPGREKGKPVFKSYPHQCPDGVLCQPHTKCGPVVTVSVEKNPRLYLPIPRDTKRFKELYALRSGCERSNSLKKETYKLGRRVCRNATHYLVRLYLVSLIEHATVWAKEGLNALSESDADFQKWLKAFAEKHSA